MSKITRRDFVNGTLMAAGASMFASGGASQAVMAALDPSYYPPARKGLRGSHPGSNEHAHSRAWAGKSDWGPTTDLEEVYDLVVVGGGLSGLAAAYFYQKKHGSDKKVLILENHDDFGGHAKRNEHTIDGNLQLGHGGSESFDNPHTFNEILLDLIKDIGIDRDRFKATYDAGFFKRHNLGAATFFNKRTFGEDKVVKHPFCDHPGFVEGLLRSTLSFDEAARQAPLSERGREQLLRVLKGGQHDLKVPKEALRKYASTTSYFDYLKNTLGIDDPLVLEMARHTSIDYLGGGNDASSLLDVLATGPLGGDPMESWGDVMRAGEYPPKYINKEGGTYSAENAFIEHFPDGNATTARLLVKKMIPNVAPGVNGENIILARFNYAELDMASNTARIRLNSTVVNVEHGGDPQSSSEVFVNYIKDNKSYQVKARGVVMACYNMIVPHIVPNLPKEQDAALRALSKIPLQYSTVGVRNWRAMKELGLGLVMCPGNMHQAVGMDFPVSIGGYEHTKTPDDPCILLMRSAPRGDTNDIPSVQQFKEARYKMLGLTFEDYEQEIREHLTGMLPSGLFDFDRDVASISVNRWAHGYSHGDPGKVGIQPFGRITIANSDAAADSRLQHAVGQAHRAVQELA